MTSKEQILNEIKRTAEENGGKPLGINTFEKETGIKPYEWGKYWARFSDAQKDAGFIPNQLQPAYSDEFILKSVVMLMQKLDKLPTSRDFRIEKINNSKFPDYSAITRVLGNKQSLVAKILEYCRNKKIDNVIKLCEDIIDRTDKEGVIDDTDSRITGEVYLFKSGKYYKIGKTNDTVRRGSELKIQLPEKIDMIHSIKTDDPSGIEAYWHKRFDNKRLNGEWFDLNLADIKTFKRWRKIY